MVSGSGNEVLLSLPVIQVSMEIRAPHLSLQNSNEEMIPSLTVIEGQVENMDFYKTPLLLPPGSNGAVNSPVKIVSNKAC